MPTFARALAAALLCLPLAFAAPAHADLTLDVVSTSAAEIAGNDDGVVGPGDRIRVDVTLSTGTALSAATGTLRSATPGVTVNAETADFTDAPAGGQTSNTMPFDVVLAGDMACGANLAFGLDLEAGDETGSVGLTIPTGTQGPLNFTAGPAAQPLADDATTNVPLDLTTGGRVKRMEVRIGSLSHPRLEDLELLLIAPDGAPTMLAEAGTLSGTSMTNTVFAAGQPPIAGAAAPYSGRYAPVGDLGDLEGRVLNGTWRLRVVDTAPGEAGTLGTWGLDAARAYCFGIPKAAFSMSPSTVTPGGTVQFNGGLSADAEGAIVKYEWDLDGDGAYDDGLTAQVQRTYPTKGRYSVKLRVTDSDGLTDVHVRELAVTLPPVAALSATPSNPLSSETFRLDAAGSGDPDGSIVRYQWDLDNNGVFERDTQGVSFLDASIATPGNVTLRVLITDEDGAQDEESVVVSVRNRPPVAAIGDPGLVLKDRPATLSAAGSTDPDGGVARYEWDLDGNGSYETDRADQPTVSHVFTTAGDRTVRVRVTDNLGLTATTTATVTVSHAPLADVTATPAPVSLRRDVTFDASASSDPDGAGALTFAWDLDDDGDFESAGGATRTLSWPTAGPRTVRVEVTDQSGAASVDSATVLVRNVLPLGAIAANPTAPRAGQAVQLSAAGSSDGDGTIVRFQWDRDGDGTYELDTGTTPSAGATFANAGNVTVGVRVTDDDGGTGTKALTLGVLPALVTTPPPTTPPVDGTVTPPPPGDTPPSDTPTQPAGGPDDAPPAPGARPFGAWVGGAAIQRLRTVISRGLLVSCRADADVTCSLTASLSARDAKRLRLGRRAVTVARGTLPVRAGTTTRKRLALTAKARRALRGTRGVRLLVRAVARTADGREVALTRVVLLRG